MKSALIAFGIVLCLLLSAFATDNVEIPYYNVDIDTLTPSQNHAMLAQSKIRGLDKLRSKSNITRASFFDQAEYDVTYYVINIEIDVNNEYVDSSFVTIFANSVVDGLDTLELDFVDSMPYGDEYLDYKYLIVDSVYTENERLNFTHQDDKIIVELDRTYNTGEEFSFTVRYHGLPFSTYQYISSNGKMNGDGLAFGTQRSLLGGASGIPVAYTNCEPYESRKWWPCKDRPDDKADSVDLYVSIETPYYCVSNGVLKSRTFVKGLPGYYTFHYESRHPIVTYLVALAISDYTVWSDWYHYSETDSMEIIQHVYPELYEDTYGPLQITPYALGVLSDLYCQYPFIDEKYGHAHWEVTGAMEHQTCTSTYCDTWGTSEPVVVHEMAHQWFGDMITCKSWHDIWLNEGFASYSEALYFEQKYGMPYYHSYMNGMEYYDDRSVYVYDTTRADDVFDIVVYDKGAWVLHSLRYYVGDDAFFNLIHEYANSQYVDSSLTTEEFIDFAETSTGVELSEFFNDWVYGILYPVYGKQYYITQDLSDGQYWVYFNLLQTQTYGSEVFEMPLELRFYDGGTVLLDTTVFNNSNKQRFVFKTSQIPDSIIVDPDNWLLNASFRIPWTYGLIQHPMNTADQFLSYLDTIICVGGSGLNQFQIISGALPDGLMLDAGTGVISGAAAEFGDFSFTVRADDTKSSYYDELEFTISVNEGIGWPGDANLDGIVDILDIVFIINYKYKNATPPEIPVLADANDDCIIDILDIVQLINFKYKGGSNPLLGCATLK